MPREDGRANDELRPIKFHRGFIGTADGSCLVEFGNTRVICTASVEDGVPSWLKGRGLGWVTAEYAMLPGSTGRRKPRDGRRGSGVDGRTVEIQRLVGRALRPVVDRKALGERTIYLDCDVIEADGGTRTTAINGAWLALADAIDGLKASGRVKGDPLINEVGAISVGILENSLLLDVCYEEDRNADADINVVMTASGELLEIQAGAEGRPFSKSQLDATLELAEKGIGEVLALRRSAREGRAGA